MRLVSAERGHDLGEFNFSPLGNLLLIFRSCLTRDKSIYPPTQLGAPVYRFLDAVGERAFRLRCHESSRIFFASGVWWGTRAYIDTIFPVERSSPSSIRRLKEDPDGKKTITYIYKYNLVLCRACLVSARLLMISPSRGEPVV